MLTKQSSPVDIEYHVEQMKILRISEKEVDVIQKVLQLESIVADKSVSKFIDKELGDESWNYETQTLINACKKKLEKDVVINNHIKECYNFMIFRYMEEKMGNFPTIVVSKEGNHKGYKWIFTCHSRHEGDDPVRWANMKLTKAMENSTSPALFEMMQDDNEEVVINEKWLIDNKQSFYSSDIFEDTNTLLLKKERERVSSTLVVSPSNVEKVQEQENPNNQNVESSGFWSEADDEPDFFQQKTRVVENEKAEQLVDPAPAWLLS